MNSILDVLESQIHLWKIAIIEIIIALFCIFENFHRTLIWIKKDIFKFWFAFTIQNEIYI